VDRIEKDSSSEEAELVVLAAEANAAFPKTLALIDHSIERLDATHTRLDALLRESGIRK
jgi:hypothetical protein